MSTRPPHTKGTWLMVLVLAFGARVILAQMFLLFEGAVADRARLVLLMLPEILLLVSLSLLHWFPVLLEPDAPPQRWRWWLLLFACLLGLVVFVWWTIQIWQGIWLL